MSEYSDERLREREGMASDALAMLDHKAGLAALDMARSPGFVRRFGRYTVAAIGLYMVLVLVLPWQQFVSGKGRVVAFNPLERPLVLEAPLSGRILHSYVVEGQQVHAGELLFTMADNDPELLDNVRNQVAAASTEVGAATEKVTQMRGQLEQKENSLPQVIAAADQKLEAARFASQTAALQFDRIQALYENPMGLVSQREFELATLERDKTAAELLQARADRQKAELDIRAEIAKARADLNQARADSASKAKDLTSIQSKLNQTSTLEVTAPRDGVIFRVRASEGTFLSAGKPLAMIVPETDNRMVELWLDGNDVPLVQERQVGPDGSLVQEGSLVRLQFEGWPAVQFIGWPSVARGTFGGEVVLIDPTDDGTGRFRVLVAPRPDIVREGEVVEWPGSRWLRQGVLVNGWVLLQRVPAWYEIWRQLNGFPPALPTSPEGGGAET